MKDWIQIDGIGINAASIRAKSKPDAIKELAGIGDAPGETAKDRTAWAEKVYSEFIKPVSKKENSPDPGNG